MVSYQRVRLTELTAYFKNRFKTSGFARNAAYLTGITGIERVAALVQTILLARALGISEYGVYGLLFSTIGFVASVMGLQMGLTATVFVARYRDSDKTNAGAVIRYVMRFAFAVSGVFLFLSLPFLSWLSDWLLQSADYRLAIAMGCFFVVASIMSGVQDGVVEGFEDFRSVAIARLVGTLLTLSLIYPVTVAYRLNGALVVLLAGVMAKYFLLLMVAVKHKKENAIPSRGGDVRFWVLVKDFSLPSMLVSLLLGAVMWFGMYLLSRLPTGFTAVAVVNVGLQWRGPILLITDALGRVAVPIFSRHESAGDDAASQRFKRKLIRVSGIASVASALVLSASADFLLSLYGKDFRSGWLEFAILMAAVVPQVLANVYMQELVGRGRMWRQFLLYLPLLLVAGLGFLLMVPRWGGLGFACSVFLARVTFVGFANRYSARRCGVNLGVK